MYEKTKEIRGKYKIKILVRKMDFKYTRIKKKR